MDPLVQAVLTSLEASFADLRNAVTDMDAEGLNWWPGENTNSIAAQVSHALAGTRFWVDAGLSPAADRAAFLAERESHFNFGADSFALLDIIQEAQADLTGALRRAQPVHLADKRDWPGYWDRGPVSAAWCLLHAAEHLREHIGSIWLTGQLWLQRKNLTESPSRR